MIAESEFAKQTLNPDPFEIWGKMVYLGLDGEGNIHLFIRKSKSKISSRKLAEVKSFFEGRTVKIIIKRLV